MQWLLCGGHAMANVCRHAAPAISAGHAMACVKRHAATVMQAGHAVPVAVMYAGVPP
jgi:hypothetical protein